MVKMYMRKKVITMAEIKYYFPGMTLLAIAVIIVAFPEVLIAMIAATIMFAGAVALYIGHVIRKGFDEQGCVHGSAFDKFLIAQPIFRQRYDRF